VLCEPVRHASIVTRLDESGIGTATETWAGESAARAHVSGVRPPVAVDRSSD
jgi:hypothetical protein